MTDHQSKRPIIKWGFGWGWIGILLGVTLLTMMQSDSAFWSRIGAGVFIVLFLVFVVMCLLALYFYIWNLVRHRRRKRRRGETA